MRDIETRNAVIDACEAALNDFGVTGGIAKGAAEGIAWRVIVAYREHAQDSKVHQRD